MNKGFTHDDLNGVRCSATTRCGPRAGLRCGQFCEVGATVCRWHGGASPLAKEAQRRRLEGLVEDAIETLRDTMLHSKKPAVRAAAARHVLDRAGYGPSQTVTVAPGSPLRELPPAEVIKRLDAARAAMLEAPHDAQEPVGAPGESKSGPPSTGENGPSGREGP